MEKLSWATGHIAKLKAGEIVSFRPRGNSMVPKIRSGQLCTVEPIKNDPIKGDIVLCRVKGHDYLHNVLAVRGSGFQIGNNKGRINGWISRAAIYGKLVKVE